MYHLNDVWNNVFEEIRKNNEGILVIHEKDKLKVLSDVNIKNTDKLSMLLNEDVLCLSDFTANIISDLMNGKVSVRHGSCPAYLHLIQKVRITIEKNQLECEKRHLLAIIKNSIRARKYMSNKKILCKQIEYKEVEAIEYQDDLEIISACVCKMIDSSFSELLNQKERGYIKKKAENDLNDNNVWDFFAWIIYNALLNMDYSDAKRDKSLISENIEQLDSVINVTKTVKTNKSRNINVPEIKSFQEMCDLGYTSLQIGRALVDNDNLLYNLGDNHKNEGSPELWASFLEAYPETFAYLVQDKKIVGNYSLVALTEEQVELLLIGELNEADFALEKNDSFVFPGEYILYLLNFSVNIGWNTVENYNILWAALLKQIEKYASQGIFFEKIYVNTFRSDHRALYKRLGFEFCVDNKIQGQVYELKSFPQDLKWFDKKSLEELYKNR